MATTTWDAWYNDVVPHVGDAPLPFVADRIRAAVIEFLKTSKAWRYTGLTAIDAVANQQTYVIGTGAAVGTLPAQVVVAHIFQVNYAGTEVEQVIPKEFMAKSPTWKTDTGTPECVTLLEEGEMSFYRIPAANSVGAITVPLVALAPTQAAAGVDSRIFEKYREVIAKGARGLLHSIPKKPYTDLMLGYSLLQEFRAAANTAGARAASGRGHARLRTATLPRG